MKSPACLLRSVLGRWFAVGVFLATPALASAQADAPAPVPAASQPASAPATRPAVADEDTTILLNLNNVPIDQLVSFLSTTTGKTVMKGKDINQQVTINSPRPVTKKQALALICDVLQMDNIYVVEDDDRIQIINAQAIKNLKLPTFSDSDDLQLTTDSLRVAHKIYKLKHISAENLKKHLEKFVPEAAITVDQQSNTVVLTDNVIRLKRYDQVVRVLDLRDQEDRVTETFKLQKANAIELATLLGNIMKGDGQVIGLPQGGGGGSDNYDRWGRRQSNYSARERASVMAIQAGEIVFIPDTRMNWLIVNCPRERLAEVKRLVEEFDLEQPRDVQMRTIPINHADATTIADAVSQLFRDATGGTAKDVIRTVPTDDGQFLIVYSSEENFKLIGDLVTRLDGETSERRETHTYQVKHLEARHLADQLTKLFEERSSSRRPYWYYWDNDGDSDRDKTKPSFVPSPRTNSLMYLARPKDVPFIKKMIEELDVPIDPTAFEPRVYHIKHTDANELVRVMQGLFRPDQQRRGGFEDYFWRSNRTEEADPLDQQFGKLRFVVDSVTNTVVALSTNSKNYELLDTMIKKLDTLDPESCQVDIVELKYADAIEVADHLNNLFSEGAVQRPQRQPQQQPNQNNNQQDNDMDATSETQEEEREVGFWWQGGQTQRRQGNQQQAERPINTMIGNVRVVPDTRSNKLMIAAPPIYFDALRGVINKLDQPEPQVHIETRIIEINRGDERRIGLRWTPDPSSIDPAELDTALMGLANLGFIDAFGANKGEPFKASDGSTFKYDRITGKGNTILGADVNLTLLIQILAKNTDMRVILDPSLTMNNNESGVLLVGTNFPFRTGDQVTDVGSVNTTTEYRDVGIKLDIRPHINNEGEIVLKARLENSKVRPGEIIDGGLVTDVSKFNTEVAVKSGETMVIGGLRTEDRSQINRGIPYLRKVPVVNWFFGKRDRSKQVRELMFFITPHVLENDADKQEILDRAKKRLAEDEPFPEEKTKVKPNDEAARPEGVKIDPNPIDQPLIEDGELTSLLKAK